jgi:regulator of sigma E protease
VAAGPAEFPDRDRADGRPVHGTARKSRAARACAPWRRGDGGLQAGLRGGDAVTAVNGKPVQTWSELRWELMQAAIDKRDAELAARAARGGGSYRAVLPASTLAA